MARTELMRRVMSVGRWYGMEVAWFPLRYTLRGVCGGAWIAHYETPPHARDDTEDWAELRLPGAAMSDGLVVDTILLVGKGKRDKGRPMEVGEGAVEMVQSPQPDPEYSKIM